MIDLRIATNCIKVMKEYRTYDNQKIGIIHKIDNLISYSDGQIVLFSEELTPSNSQLCMGEYMGMKQKPTGRVTTEIPLTPEEIRKEKERGSLITTMGTIINVPRRYVEEIRF